MLYHNYNSPTTILSELFVLWVGQESLSIGIKEELERLPAVTFIKYSHNSSTLPPSPKLIELLWAGTPPVMILILSYCMS